MLSGKERPEGKTLRRIGGQKKRQAEGGGEKGFSFTLCGRLYIINPSLISINRRRSLDENSQAQKADE